VHILFAGKLIEGAGWVPEEVGKGITAIGSEISKPGKKIGPKKSNFHIVAFCGFLSPPSREGIVFLTLGPVLSAKVIFVTSFDCS